MRVLASIALAGMSVACAPTLPTSHPVERALVRDVARVVDTRDQVGWLIDEVDIEATLADAMSSVCRVAPSRRTSAAAWLDARIDELGGDAAARWKEGGRKLSAVKELLMVTRAHMLLERAMEWADDGHCPFWIEVDEEFAGRQGVNSRVLLSAETGGRFYVQSEDGQPGFGGGGGLRLFAGYGWSDELTLLLGMELGGAGRFTNLELGERIEVPEVLLLASAPVMLRFHALSNHIDLELGPIAYLNQLRGEAQFGGRIAVGFGVSRLRVRLFVPTVSFALNYDFVPGTTGLPAVHQVGMGIRAGFMLPL